MSFHGTPGARNMIKSMKIPRLEAMKFIIFMLVSYGPDPEMLVSVLTIIVRILRTYLFHSWSLASWQSNENPLNNHYMLQYASCIVMMIANACAKLLCQAPVPSPCAKPLCQDPVPQHVDTSPVPIFFINPVPLEIVRHRAGTETTIKVNCHIYIYW